MIQSKNALVILSLPFQRLIRSHLSPPVLRALSSQADLALVSPFAETPKFVRRYSGKKRRHILSPSDHILAPWLKRLYQVSAFLRIRGYWFRHRREIPYYWANRHHRAGSQTPVVFRPFLDLLSWVGAWKKAWRLIDALHGSWTYCLPKLENLAGKYTKVILIQTASWGFQEAALGWLGRKNRWNSIFLPYSMDQLFCNGYLVNDFQQILTQGKRETTWAQRLHGIPRTRIYTGGSPYLQRLAGLSTGNKRRVSVPAAGNILYAGLDPVFFPRELEIAAVKCLADFLSDRYGQLWEMVYRPVCLKKDEICELRAKLKHRNRIRIKIPGPSAIGLSHYRDSDPLADIRALVRQFGSVRVAVSSLVTGLSLEAAHLGVPTVAYFPDHPLLQEKHSQLLLNQSGRVMGLEPLPVAKNFSELVNSVLALLKDSKAADRIVRATQKLWPASGSEFSVRLEEMVFGRCENAA